MQRILNRIMKRPLHKKELTLSEADLRWNQFIQTVCMGDGDNLSPAQRNAFLCFWYDAEVNNGGHGQYFDLHPHIAPEEAAAAVRAVATSIIEITREGVRTFPGGYDYYCEKKAQREAAQRDGRAASQSPPQETPRLASASSQPGASGAPALTSKELRQQRAAARAKIAPRVKELKRIVETSEKKIDELQASLDAASEELFNPKPTTDFAEANRKVRTLQFEIERYTADWEAAATELEELTKDAGD